MNKPKPVIDSAAQLLEAVRTFTVALSETDAEAFKEHIQAQFPTLWEPIWNVMVLDIEFQLAQLEEFIK